MGRKSRAKKNKTKFKSYPDEIISHGPLRIERHGRHILFRNRSSPEQHQEFLARSAEGHKRLFEVLKKEIAELQGCVANIDPVVLLNRAAYEVLPLFFKYKSETEYSFEENFSLPGIEYLQYLISRTEPNPSQDKKIAEEEWKRIWNLVKRVLSTMNQWLLTRPVGQPPTSLDELRFFLDNKRLSIRIERYPAFLLEHWRDVLIPYDDYIKRAYGKTAEELVLGLSELHEYQRTGLVNRYQDFIQADKELMSELQSEDALTALVRTGGDLRETLLASKYGQRFAEVEEKARLALTSAVFDVTEVSTLPTAVLELLSVRPGESILTDLESDDDLSPLSTSSLHYKPLLRVDGHFYLFLHSGLEDRISDIIERDLLERFPQEEPALVRVKSVRLEELAKGLLDGLISPDFSHANLSYPDPDNAGSDTELDVLIGLDDVLFLIECKSGGLSDAASRGAPKSLLDNLSTLIVEGQRQAERAEKYIRSSPTATFIKADGSKVVIESKKIRRIVRVIVTREPLGWVGSRIARLSILDDNLTKDPPWHISLDDLRPLADIFEGKNLQFIHYLEERLEAAKKEEIDQSDEIDHLALYLKINQYHLPEFSGGARVTHGGYAKDLDYYFAEKYSAESTVERPEQYMPPKLKSLILALTASRCAGRSEVVSFLLAMDKIGRDNLDMSLDTLSNRLKEGRSSSIRFALNVLNRGISITYAQDRDMSTEVSRSAAQMLASNSTSWLVLQLTEQEGLSIKKIDKITLDNLPSAEELADAEKYLDDRTAEIVSKKKIGRNEVCPCGSGKKFKKCHGR